MLAESDSNPATRRAAFIFGLLLAAMFLLSGFLHVAEHPVTGMEVPNTATDGAVENVETLQLFAANSKFRPAPAFRFDPLVELVAYASERLSDEASIPLVVGAASGDLIWDDAAALSDPSAKTKGSRAAVEPPGKISVRFEGERKLPISPEPGEAYIFSSAPTRPERSHRIADAQRVRPRTAKSARVPTIVEGVEEANLDPSPIGSGYNGSQNRDQSPQNRIANPDDQSDGKSSPPVRGLLPLETSGSTVDQTTDRAPGVEAPEIGVPEIGVPEAVAPEAVAPEAGVPEAGVREAGVREAGVPEAGVPEAGVPEAGVPEAGVPEAGVPEADVPEAGVPDVEKPANEGTLEADATANGERLDWATFHYGRDWRLANQEFIQRDRARQQRIHRTLDFYYARPLNSNEDSPWSMMHWLIAWGKDSKMYIGRPTGRLVNTVDWLCSNGVCERVQLLTLSKGDLRAKNGPGLQGHDGQFLAMLAQARVDVSQSIQVGGRVFDVDDLIRVEQMTCRPRTELTFKLIGFSHYLDSDAQWQDHRGGDWSISRLIREEIVQAINGVTCGGTHRLMGLHLVTRRREAEGKPLDGQWARADKYIRDYQNYALTLQNRDGSFSSDFFKGRSSWGDIDRKIKTTGHILEFLVFSLPSERLLDARIARGVDYLCNIMMRNRYYVWPKGPLSHAVRALSLYEERVHGVEPGARNVRMAPLSDFPRITKTPGGGRSGGDQPIQNLQRIFGRRR